MANITNYLNKIKTAVYGKDVRGAIHDAIKQVYDDASVNHDNANMEVKMARGTHNTLNDRLDKSEQKLDETNAQLSQIENDIPYETFKKQTVGFGDKTKLNKHHMMFAKKTYGRYEDGCVASVIANTENPRAEIIGTNTKGLSKYDSRDSVSLYVHNQTALPTLECDNVSYAELSVTVTDSSDLSKLKPGMIIDTKHTPNHYVGIIKSINDKTIEVIDGWYKVVSGVGSETPSTPSNDKGFYVNKMTKIWGINNNIIIDKGVPNAVAEEIGVFTNHAEIGIVGGIDLVNFKLSSHFGYKARGVTVGFQKGFVSEKSDIHFIGEQSKPTGTLLQSINSDGSSWYVKNSGLQSELALEIQVVTTSTSANANKSIFIITTPGVTLKLPTPKHGKIIKIVVQGDPSTGNKTKLLTHNEQAYIRFPSLAFPEIPFTKNGYCELVSDGISWYATSSTIYN